MNGHTDCDPTAPMPLEYHQSSAVAELEQPFLIKRNEGIVVSHDEPHWVTNIRKSVANLFTVKSLRDHGIVGTEGAGLLNTQAFQETPSYVADEETVAGICQNRYTLTKLPDYLKEEHIVHFEESVEEDVQSAHGGSGKGSHGKGSKGGSKSGGKGAKGGSKGGAKGGGKGGSGGPKLGDDVYVLTKSINYNDCKEMVKFQSYGFGFDCKMGSSQCGTLMSRSTTGSFYLRGSEDALRIEKAVVEGNVLMNPLGYETEKIRTVTNQTLELRAVRREGAHLELPESTRVVNSFMYEVESPVASADHAARFVHHSQTEDPENSPAFHLGTIVSGYSQDSLASAQETNVNDIIPKLLVEISDKFENFDVLVEGESDVGGLMDQAVNRIRMVDYNGLMILFNSFDANDDYDYFLRELLIDLMARAGTDAAVKVLVHQIKNHAISSERSAQVFMALTDSIVMPGHSLPTLFNLLEGLVMADEFQMTSSLVLNLATAVNRLCLVPQADETYPKHLLGDHACDSSWALDQFLPIVERGLQGAQDVGHKMVYIHALTMMTTERKIDILKPIILGNTETDIRVRTLACYALQAYNTPNKYSVIPQIYGLMMPVFENQGENHEVRIAAIGALLSWKPDTAWWHRLAVASWKDSSRQMQSYISHVISSVAERNGRAFDELRQRARHVLPMTKRFPPSKRFTMAMMTGAYLDAIETGIVTNLAWLHTVKSYVPVHIYEVFIAQQGSFLNLFHELILDGHFDDLMSKGPKEKPVNAKDAAARRAFNMYSQALMNLRMDEYTHFENFESTEPEHDSKFVLAARLFFNMQRVFMTDHLRTDVLQSLILPDKWNLIKYINPSEIFVAFPTDIGVAFIGTASAPMVLHSKGISQLKSKGLSIDMNFFASFKVQAKAHVAVPWADSVVASGFEIQQDVMLPLTMEALVDLPEKEVTLSVSPVGSKKMSFMKHHNRPFTFQDHILHYDPSSSKNEGLKVILEHGTLFKDHIDLGHHHTGMALDLDWTGDIESPFNLPSVLEFLLASPEQKYRLGVAPTLQYYEYSLNYDPEQSQTDTISATFSIKITDRSEGMQDPTGQQFTQQSGGDFGELTQQSGGDFVEFGDLEVQTGDFEQVPSQGGEGGFSDKLINFDRTVSLFSKVKFTGSEVHKYEVALTWTNDDHKIALGKTQSKAQVTFLKATDAQTEYEVCIDLESSRPYISHLVDLSDTLQHDLKSTWHVELREGGNCRDSAVANAEMYFDMSQLRKDTILSTLSSEDFCPKDLEVHEHIQAVYDEADIQITWAEDRMACSGVMNLTYHADDLIRSLLFPHVTFNYCGAKNPPGQVTIEASRSLDTNLWTVWTHKPTEISFIDHLDVNMLNDLVSFDHDYHHTDYDIPLLHDECHIYEHHINTFDGVDYPHESNPCWQVLVMDVDHFESWVLLQSYVQHPEPGTELRFINPQGMFVTDITATEVKVNGKPVIMAQDREVVRHDGKIQCVVELYKDEIYVEFPDILSVSMKGSHVVVKMDHYTVGGLCGSRDGEATADLQGPNKCVYYEPELFATSWIAGGEGECDLYALEEQIARVEEYQSHCPKVHPYPTGPNHKWE